MVHSQRVLDIDRALAFDAGTAITRNRKTIFNRFFQPLVYTCQEFFLRFAPHVLIVSREQTPRRIESEQSHGMKSLFTQVRRDNAVVGQRVAIHLARRLLRQSAFTRLVVTGIHLFVAFVAVKSPAKRFLAWYFFAFNFGNPRKSMFILNTEPSSVRSGCNSRPVNFASTFRPKLTNRNRASTASRLPSI